MGAEYRRPSALASVVFACVGLSWSVKARATDEDPATLQARALYRDGIHAYTEKRYEASRAAFVKVHDLKPLEVEVLRDLGAAEVRTGRMVDGAQHLDDWLRLSSRGTERERNAVGELLIEAKQTVGALRINVDVSGAEVTVDERAIGASPFDHDVYVTSGAHVVRAQIGESRAEESVNARPNLVTSVSLSPRRMVPASVVVEPVGEPIESTGIAQPGGFTAPTSSPTETPTQPMALREQHAGALLFGAGIALAGAGLGAILTESANQADQDANQLDALVRSRSPCTDGCGEPESARDEGRRDRSFAVVSFAAAGVAALGTAAYFIWVPERPRSSRSARPIVMGALVALTGLATGIVSTTQATSDQHAANLSGEALSKLGLGNHGCSPGTQYVTECAALFKENRDLAQDHALRIAGFALAGAAVLGTTAYLFWPNSSNAVPVGATLGFNGQNRTLVVFGSF